MPSGDSTEALKAIWMEGYWRGRADMLRDINGSAGRGKPPVVKIEPADIRAVYAHSCGNAECPACGTKA